MATPESSLLVVGSLRGGVASAGGIDKLVALLSASSGKARAAAAMALYHLCIASPEFCSRHLHQPLQRDAARAGRGRSARSSGAHL